QAADSSFLKPFLSRTRVISVDDIESCKQYIMGQEEHHRVHNLLDELEEMAGRNGLEWYTDDWD
ncbi:MAG: hypothetical protein ACI4AX_06020, partial [Muribaculaceae bacterium]